MGAVSETEEEAPVPTDVADVTACAPGLAFSEHHGADAVEELVSVAQDRRETLAAARDALDRYPSGDPTVVDTAAELLSSAAETARSARS